MDFGISQNAFQILAQICNCSMAQGGKFTFLEPLPFHLCGEVIRYVFEGLRRWYVMHPAQNLISGVKAFLSALIVEQLQLF